jgi:hypothetical protein
MSTLEISFLGFLLLDRFLFPIIAFCKDVLLFIGLRECWEQYRDAHRSHFLFDMSRAVTTEKNF